MLQMIQNEENENVAIRQMEEKLLETKQWVEKITDRERERWMIGEHKEI